jgi:hypothetical protein
MTIARGTPIANAPLEPLKRALLTLAVGPAKEATMGCRRLASAAVFGAVVLSSPAALADEASAPPPTVVVDASDPVCQDSKLVCSQLEPSAATPEDRINQMRAVGPILRELRRCLNHQNFSAVPATLRIKWADTVTVEVARGLDTHPCILQAKAKVAATKSATPVALSCTYQCEGGVIPPGPAAPPPPAPPPPTPPPEPKPEPPPVTTIEPPPPVVHASRPASGWYGWQTLIADGASAVVLTGGLVSWTVEPTVIGYAGFLFGTPVVHAIHGNYGRMLGSFGLRLLLPAVAGGIGAAVEVGGNAENTTVKGVVTSAGIGIGLAAAACIIIDAGFLAWDTKEPSRSGKNDWRLDLLRGRF